MYSLTACEKVTGGDSTREGINRHQPRGQTFQTPRSCPRPGGSMVVLSIQYEERRRTLQDFMESLEIEVMVVNQWEHLSNTLKEIKQRGSHSGESFPGLSSESRARNSTAKDNGVLTSNKNGDTAMGFILIVIDANAGPSVEVCRMVSDFRRGFLSPCKVVWINKPLMRGVNYNAPDEDILIQMT